MLVCSKPSYYSMLVCSLSKAFTERKICGPIITFSKSQLATERSFHGPDDGVVDVDDVDDVTSSSALPSEKSDSFAESCAVLSARGDDFLKG